MPWMPPEENVASAKLQEHTLSRNNTNLSAETQERVILKTLQGCSKQLFSFLIEKYIKRKKFKPKISASKSVMNSTRTA